MKEFSYAFTVPEHKKVRVIVDTDCKAEADDQYALAHHFMTPKFKVEGVIGCHFARQSKRYVGGDTAQASCDEIQKIMELMDIAGACPVVKGSGLPMEDECTPVPSEASRFIIEQAMQDSELPLYIACQGALTDLASAILEKPEICSRMTAVWIGGGAWPKGGPEANLAQDIPAANVVFSSQMPLWQIPFDVYREMAVTLAELQWRVAPCGAVGKYLFENMARINAERAGDNWPYGEFWALGDQGTVTVLIDSPRRQDYELYPAPRIHSDMTYDHTYKGDNRAIKVFKSLDARFTLEDFYAKLALNYPPGQ